MIDVTFCRGSTKTYPQNVSPGQPCCRRPGALACGEMKKKEEGLTFVCAGGDSCNVELLHDDEQHRDGDGDQHAACTEQGKVIVDQRAREHVVQANRDGP